jgi:hypothetical protein
MTTKEQATQSKADIRIVEGSTKRCNESDRLSQRQVHYRSNPSKVQKCIRTIWLKKLRLTRLRASDKSEKFAFLQTFLILISRLLLKALLTCIVQIHLRRRKINREPTETGEATRTFEKMKRQNIEGSDTSDKSNQRKRI